MMDLFIAENNTSINSFQVIKFIFNPAWGIFNNYEGWNFRIEAWIVSS